MWSGSTTGFFEFISTATGGATLCALVFGFEPFYFSSYLLVPWSWDGQVQSVIGYLFIDFSVFTSPIQLRLNILPLPNGQESEGFNFRPRTPNHDEKNPKKINVIES